MLSYIYGSMNIRFITNAITTH